MRKLPLWLFAFAIWPTLALSQASTLGPAEQIQLTIGQLYSDRISLTWQLQQAQIKIAELQKQLSEAKAKTEKDNAEQKPSPSAPDGGSRPQSEVR